MNGDRYKYNITLDYTNAVGTGKLFLIHRPAGKLETSISITGSTKKLPRSGHLTAFGELEFPLDQIKSVYMEWQAKEWEGEMTVPNVTLSQVDAGGSVNSEKTFCNTDSLQHLFLGFIREFVLCSQ